MVPVHCSHNIVALHFYQIALLSFHDYVCRVGVNKSKCAALETEVRRAHHRSRPAFLVRAPRCCQHSAPGSSSPGSHVHLPNAPAVHINNCGVQQHLHQACSPLREGFLQPQSRWPLGTWLHRHRCALSSLVHR